jgi:hypothetical protein
MQTVFEFYDSAASAERHLALAVDQTGVHLLEAGEVPTSAPAVVFNPTISNITPVVAVYDEHGVAQCSIYNDGHAFYSNHSLAELRATAIQALLPALRNLILYLDQRRSPASEARPERQRRIDLQD